MKKKRCFAKKLSKCYIVTSSDLWLFWGAHDIFTFVINFKGLIGSQNMFTIGLFKATKVISQALRRHLIQVLNEYELKQENSCFSKIWKVKSKCYENYFKVYCELWMFGLGRKLLKILFGYVFFLKYANVWQ